MEVGQNIKSLFLNKKKWKPLYTTAGRESQLMSSVSLIVRFI